MRGSFAAVPRARTSVVALAIGALAAAPAVATPRPGSLDHTFGHGTGIVKTALPTAAGGAVQVDTVDGVSVANTPDGGFVAGASQVPSGTSSAPFEMALAKYHADGSLNTAFGSGGFAITSWNTIGLTAQLGTILVLPDGSILEGGGAASSGTKYKLAVVRWAANGKSELGYACYIVPGATAASITGMTLQADGKVDAVATSQTGGPAGAEFAFIRFDPTKLNDEGCGASTATDPSLDTSFGSSGFTLVDFGPGGGFEEASSGIAAEPKSSFAEIIADGYATDGMGNHEVAVVLLNESDGSPDTSVQPGGKELFQVPPGNGAAGTGLEYIPTPGVPHLYVSGATFRNGEPQPFLARVDDGGSLDPSFGPNGQVLLGGFGAFSARAFVAVQPDVKPVVVWEDQTEGGGDGAFDLARLSTTGAPDTDFGHSGRTTVPLSGGASSPSDLVVRPSGAILAAGDFTPKGGNAEIALVQLAGGSVSDLRATLGTPAKATVGKPLTVSATITNAGPDLDGRVHLRVTIPAGLELVSVTVPQFYTCKRKPTLDCSRVGGELGGGQTVSYILHLKAKTAGKQTITATASGANFDPVPANNHARAAVSVAKKR